MAGEPFGMDLWKYQDYKIQQEVYQKAKAFDEIRNIEDEYYNKHYEFISTEDFVYAVDTILNNYKRSGACRR